MEPARRDDPEASGRLLFALALLAGALLRVVQLGQPDLFGADEGSWAVGARNLAESWGAQIVGLSRTPLGPPSGTPVLFPAILSIMVRIFGPVEWAVRLPSVLAGLVGAFVLERIVRRSFGQPAGHLAGAFAALFPPLVAASRAATVEPTLVALGLGGVIFGLRAFEEDAPAEAVLAGALFGLGFLAKGYAVGLFLLPLLAALAFRRDLFGLGRTGRSLVLLLSSFVAVGSLHLAAVALFSPSSFAFQLASAFGASEASARAAIEPTAFGADVRTIVRTLFLFLPLVGLGAVALAREAGEDEIASGATGGTRRLSHAALWGAYGLEALVMVILAGRLRLSSIPVMPAFAALAGDGGAALLRPLAEERGRRREFVAAALAGAVVLGAAALLMAAPQDPLFGGRHTPMSSGAALVAIAAVAAGAALVAAGRGPGNGKRSAVFLSLLLVAGGIFSAFAIRHDLLTHRTGAREVAEQISPVLAPLAPAELAFRAPEPDAIAFRLFRTGRTWSGVPTREVLQHDGPGTRCWVYVAGAPPGSRAPSADVREWLGGSTREVTDQVDARAGRLTGLRVFVAKDP